MIRYSDSWKRAALTGAILTAVLLGYGCGEHRSRLPSSVLPRASESVIAFPLVIKDDAGRVVRLSRPPVRIVSLAPSNTEILYALGLGDRVAAVDAYSDYPSEAKRKPRIGGYGAPSIESVIATAPDLILGAGIHPSDTVHAFEANNLTTVLLDPQDLEGMLRDIVLVGHVTGRSHQADDLVRALRRRIDAVVSQSRGRARPRVYFELGPDLYTAGPGSFVNDLIERAGGTNVAAGTGAPWPQLSQEALLVGDVDVILIGDHVAGVTAAQMRRRSGWQELKAIRTNRIVTLDRDITVRPGPRLVDGLEAIARALR